MLLGVRFALVVYICVFVCMSFTPHWKCVHLAGGTSNTMTHHCSCTNVLHHIPAAEQAVMYDAFAMWMRFNFCCTSCPLNYTLKLHQSTRNICCSSSCRSHQLAIVAAIAFSFRTFAPSNLAESCFPIAPLPPATLLGPAALATGAVCLVLCMATKIC